METESINIKTDDTGSENPNNQPTADASGTGFEAEEAKQGEPSGAENATAGTENTEENPESRKLAGKFDSTADLEKAYENLQAKLGQQQTDRQEEAGDDEKADQAAANVVNQAGLDQDELTTKFMSEGDISDSDYEALEKAGIPREMTQSYLEGLRQQANSERSEVLSTLGENSEEKFSAIQEWAGNNLSETAIDTFNRMVNSGDKEQAKMAVENLSSKYSAAMGQEPSLINTTTTQSSQDVYSSMQEVTRDMADSRYKSGDAQFQQSVQEKLRRSNLN